MGFGFVAVNQWWLWCRGLTARFLGLIGYLGLLSRFVVMIEFLRLMMIIGILIL